ncbi:MAG: DNA primase [Planctomycetes bacterium]|nr:DNA primase [Planctomycetota bacterium]
MGFEDFQSAKEQVKARTDIVRLVSESVPLKRAGRGYTGLCPFHDEKTPSFHVFPDSQHFKCFGCGEGGDCFSFVMKKENLDFREALTLLAKEAGVELPRTSARDRAQSRERDDFHRVLAEVQVWFAERLAGPEGAGARDYVASRGLDTARAEFSLGYAPGSSFDGPQHLVNFLRQRRLPVETAIALGLVGKSARGYFDRLRNRLVFPIHDERGRVVGFGGRILPGFESEREPKYWNSPESPVFNKRQVLFGLHQARQKKAKRLLVMEGYTDVIAVQMAGLHGAVATLGTSLTRDHAGLLRRFSPEGVTLVFDGDAAGRRAAERAFRELAGETLSARICLLPDGLDPADLVGRSGRAAFEAVLDESEDALEVWFTLMDGKLQLQSVDGRAAATRECVEILGSVTDRARREFLLQRFSARLMIPPDVLIAGMRPARRQQGGEESRVAAAPAKAAGSAVEKARAELCAALLAEPELLEELIECSLEIAELFPASGHEHSFVADTFERFLEEGALPTADELLSRWLTRASGDSDATRVVLAWSDLSRCLEDPRSTVERGVGFLERERMRTRVDALRESYRKALSAGNDGEARQLELEMAESMRRLHRPG